MGHQNNWGTLEMDAKSGSRLGGDIRVQWEYSEHWRRWINIIHIKYLEPTGDKDKDVQTRPAVEQEQEPTSDHTINCMIQPDICVAV